MDAPENSLEIEAKFQVTSFEHVRNHLWELRIPCSGVEYQRDVYYASSYRDFGETDEALRVRYGDGITILTYKGPKLATHGLKAREEINVRVNPGEDLEKILQRLGYSPVYTVEKKRERYERVGIEISLDEVKGLGTYVEIELKIPQVDPEEAIAAMKKKLGIEGEHIPLSYLELLRLRETSGQPGYPSLPH